MKWEAEKRPMVGVKPDRLNVLLVVVVVTAAHLVDEEEDEQLEAELDEAELKSESDIIAQARADLPPAAFERWLSARNTPTS